MRKFIQGNVAKALLSGLLTAFAASHVNFIFAWLCFIPLFMVLGKQVARQAAVSGIVFGLGVAIPCFYWMIPAAQRFTGGSMLYGIIAYVISAIVLCIYFGLLTFCFGLLKKSATVKTGIIFSNALLAACLFTIFEWLLMLFSRHMPWFEFHSGTALSGNLAAIQPAEFFGIHILGFTAVLVNYLFASYIVTKQWTKLFIPAALAGIYLLTGYLLIPNTINNTPEKSVSVAILAQNLPPETKWGDDTGDALANTIFALDSTAMLMKPDIALWSESVIPWTYRSDDEMLAEIVRISRPANITHIIGINTDGGNNVVYNSVYNITPTGKVADRMDKQVLLAFLEQPLAGLVIPFLSSGGGIVKPDDSDNRILQTPYGKAGIMICNEATVPEAAYNAAKQGAQFILNLSNDGWFSNSYLVDLHFYNVRLRAVETRLDIAVNSNDGYSGMINKRGDIIMQKKSPASFVDMVNIQKRGRAENELTLVVKQPLLFIYLCLAGLFYFAASAVISTKNQNV